MTTALVMTESVTVIIMMLEMVMMAIDSMILMD